MLSSGFDCCFCLRYIWKTTCIHKLKNIQILLDNFLLGYVFPNVTVNLPYSYTEYIMYADCKQMLQDPMKERQSLAIFEVCSKEMVDILDKNSWICCMNMNLISRRKSRRTQRSFEWMYWRRICRRLVWEGDARHMPWWDGAWSFTVATRKGAADATWFFWFDAIQL